MDVLRRLAVRWGDMRWFEALLILGIGFCAGIGVEQMFKGCP